MRETPRRKRERPVAVRTNPATSNLKPRLVGPTAGSADVNASTARKYAPKAKNAALKPNASSTIPRGMEANDETAIPPEMQPNANTRSRPSHNAGTSPSTEGVTRLAPKPTVRRPAQVNTAMVGDAASASSPATTSANPNRRLRRQPTMTPTMPPATMQAPAAREYTMEASWMSATLAPRDDARDEVAMLRAALSDDVPTWHATKTSTRGSLADDPPRPPVAFWNWALRAVPMITPLLPERAPSRGILVTGPRPPSQRSCRKCGKNPGSLRIRTNYHEQVPAPAPHPRKHRI